MKVIDHIGGLIPTNGEVGIEVEVEGRNLNLDHDNKYWHAVHDGSLRGEALEYVLKKPVPRSRVTDSLSSLKRTWVKYHSEIHDTERAGVHVHINMQKESINTLGTFITLYYCFESLLMKFCGKQREGNHFCLRVKDAEGVLDHLLTALKCKNLNMLAVNQLRYASLNLKALTSYGSLEFRGMRSTENLSDIRIWVDLLLCLKDAAKRYGTPDQVPANFSLQGGEGLIREVFGDHADMLLGYDNAVDMVEQDMRRTQEVAFCPYWQILDNRGPEKAHKIEEDIAW